MVRYTAPVLAAAIASTANAAPERYELDSSHTYPNFAISHLGMSTMYGRFNETKGSLTLDRDADSLAVEVVIAAKSIDTGHGKRDDHLRSPDFFNVAEFPEIRFESTGSTWEDGRPVSVDGNVTLLGVTKPVTLAIDAFECGEDPWKKYRCGADASLTLKRSDFGMTYGSPGIGDEFKMMIGIEGVRE